MAHLMQQCPICTSEQTQVCLSQTNAPVHQHLIFKKHEDALKMRRGNISLCVCNDCGFVFNSSFDANNLSYDQQYDNTQLSSPYFQSYVDSLVHDLIYKHNVQNSRIIEVGCGKGAFLRALVSAEGAHNTGIGFDPSYIGPNTE
jgi:hypothetical protein